MESESHDRFAEVGVHIAAGAQGETSVDVAAVSGSAPGVRILILEDNPADVVLLKRNMEKGGLSFQARVVETRDGLFEELDGFRPDIVISDYTLPSFTGIEALRLVREESWDLPFILISGTINESRAIEALQLQATDYLFKGNMGRLVPALERALRERAQRQSEANALRASEAKARSLADHGSDMMALISDAGEILDISPASRTMLGCEPHELVGRPLNELVNAEDVEIMNSTQRAVASLGARMGRGVCGPRTVSRYGSKRGSVRVAMPGAMSLRFTRCSAMSPTVGLPRLSCKRRTTMRCMRCR